MGHTRKVINIVPLPPVMPRCFDSEESWKIWNELNKSVGPASGRNKKYANYCADCSPKYQFAMSTQNRCGHPETKFIAIAGSDQFVGRR